MEPAGHTDPFAELKRATAEYNIYDAHYEKLGKVDDLVVDAGDRVIYVGVKMGLFGTNSTIVPVEIVRVNDKRRLVEISEPAESVKRAPHFGSGDDLTPELENHVRSYFGLEALHPSPEHDPQGPYIPSETSTPRDTRTDAPAAGIQDIPVTDIPPERDPSLAPDERMDVVPGERSERQPEPPVFDGDRRLIEESGGRPDEPAREGSRSATDEEGRWKPTKTVGGVTVHRVRR